MLTKAQVKPLWLVLWPEGWEDFSYSNIRTAKRCKRAFGR